MPAYTAVRDERDRRAAHGDEVAELLHIPGSTVRDYARRGVLPSIKLGRHVRFVRSDVAEAIEQLRLGRAATRGDASRSAR